ncbi:hypothetical protein HD596_001699 [Nonomuraea jabiensis]|uniref:Uncharacterized protein n=1 Tax=Nonomuraea jabiensis TaxID=882448 RepID=A0A7W9L8Y1_9ACTN|nr:hypothetical protein [Nonomuraea jabiensis]
MEADGVCQPGPAAGCGGSGRVRGVRAGAPAAGPDDPGCVRLAVAALGRPARASAGRGAA